MSSFRKCDRKFQFKLEKNKVIADKCKQQKKKNPRSQLTRAVMNTEVFQRQDTLVAIVFLLLNFSATYLPWVQKLRFELRLG